jgi:alkyl hydroperoxide reductase subunit D
MENLDNIINEIFQGNESNIAKDLKLNLKKYLGENNLTQIEIALVTLSLSHSLKLNSLAKHYENELAQTGYSLEQIKEAKEIAAFMSMLNSYYKFKNFVDNNSDYNNAGLRMNTMAKPQLTKIEFELLALVHSILNACEFCVKAHEQELKKHQMSADKIHDAVRLTSVLKAVSLIQNN